MSMDFCMFTAPQRGRKCRMQTDPRRGLPSASSAEANILCPARHQMQEGIPSESNEYSESGDLVHKALAGDKDAEASLSDEQAECFNKAKATEAAMLEEWRNGTPKGKIECKRETRLWGHKNPIDPLSNLVCSGQFDVLYIDTSTSRALLSDYKSLFGEHTESPKNIQLRWLSALAWEHYDVMEVSAFINQPNAKGIKSGSLPEVVVYNAPDLLRAHGNMVVEALEMVNAENPVVTPGEKQCKYCRAASRCLALQGIVRPLIEQREHAELVIQSMNGGQLSTFLDRLKLAEPIFDMAKKEAKARLKKDPNSIPGYKLGTPRTSRYIEDVPAAIKALCDSGIMTTKDIECCMSISVPDVEKRAKAILQGTKKEVDAKVSAVIGHLIQKNVGEAPIERE